MDDRSEILHLENQLCFPLYALSRLTTKVYAPFLKTLDITYPQYLVMLVLWQHQEQSVSELGERLMLESNTLTPLLKRLEQRGIVKRQRSEADERRVVVTLTEEGEKLKAKAICIPENIVSSFKDDSISEEEIWLFRETLQKLTGILNKKLESD